MDILFELQDGSERTVSGGSGISLMEIAVNNDIDGVLGQCGGACCCATCHVYIADDWRALVGEPNAYEKEVLSEIDNYNGSSRLACQIELRPDLNGLRVKVAEIVT